MHGATFMETRTPPAPRLERVLGTCHTGRPGPRVVVTAGIHGNEPAGTVALERVFARLARERLPLRGHLLGLAGNLEALRQNRRFVSRDLNRGWHADRVGRLLADVPGEPAAPATPPLEDREQRELAAIFHGLFREVAAPIAFLDLHSTSAGGAPFCAIADTLRNRRLAFALPVPVILGLEETIDGTMLSYLDDLGHVAVVFEGGQHQDPRTVDHHEAAIWLTLVAAGALRAEEVPDLTEHRARLAAAAADIPHVVEIRHRHPVLPDDEFVMRPGYVNFQAITPGEVLAHDRRGEVTAGRHGTRILMPLYQVQGDDGFFVVREVRRVWLRVSTVLRHLRLHVLLPILPGVRWHQDRLDTLVVDPAVARWFVVEVFHLFGFRRMRPERDKLVFSRRRSDFRKVAAPHPPAAAS